MAAKVRIVVLGAKPGAIIPNGDAIYCANAAFLTAPEVVATFSRCIIVASSTILAKGLTGPGANPAVYRTKVDAIRDVHSTGLVLFADPGRGNKIPAIEAYVTATQPARPLRIFSVAERTRLVRDSLGAYPLVDREFRTQRLGIQFRDAAEIANWWLSWQFGRRGRDVRAKYRPSTGILALLVAMADHGRDAEYVLAGIGLGERHRYSVGGELISNGKTNHTDALPIHTVADAIALRRLRMDGWSIASTEPELSGLVPVI